MAMELSNSSRLDKIIGNDGGNCSIEVAYNNFAECGVDRDGITLPVQKNELPTVQDTRKNDKYDGETSDTNVCDDTVFDHRDTSKIPRREYTTEPSSEEEFGLFFYVPKCIRNICMTPHGVLFFLCWASTMQVMLCETSS